MIFQVILSFQGVFQSGQVAIFEEKFLKKYIKHFLLARLMAVTIGQFTFRNQSAQILCRIFDTISRLGIIYTTRFRTLWYRIHRISTITCTNAIK
jgi:hypothetical protein